MSSVKTLIFPASGDTITLNYSLPCDTSKRITFVKGDSADTWYRFSIGVGVNDKIDVRCDVNKSGDTARTATFYPKILGDDAVICTEKGIDIIQERLNYLRFTSDEDFEMGFSHTASLGSTKPRIYYSTDSGLTWTQYSLDSAIWPPPSVSATANNEIWWKGDNDFTNSHQLGKFVTIKGNITVKGNVMSLIHNDDFYNYQNDFKNTTFQGLFSVSNVAISGALVDASELILPATTLTSSCYSNMFHGCSGLTAAPELPATTLATGCYNLMFADCTSLTRAPELLATELQLFCYEKMFQGCTNLNYIKAMFTTTPGGSYTEQWTDGVASSGTFVKNSSATWNVSGVSGIPDNWTVQTASS